MDKNALINVLKRARESGIRTGVLKGAPGKAMERMYAVWKTETDENIYKDLMNILRKSSDLNDFNDKMFNLGSLAIRVDYTTLANSLLYRTTEVGEEKAVEELEKYSRLESTPALGILSVSGIQVESKIELWGGISLIPADLIPDCLLKDSFNDIEIALGRIKAAMPMALDFDNSNPKSVLVKKMEIKPKSYKDDEKTEPKYYGQELYQVCDLLTLVSDSTPMALSFSMAVEEWVPCSSLLNNSGWGGRGFDVVNVGMYKLTKQDGENVSPLIRKYLELNKSIQDILMVSLQRLNLLRRRRSLVDKAIELGIALEVLLLHDGGPDVPISLPFRLRGAWLLGQDSTSRHDYLRLFKDIYACRCEAVHSGKFDSKFNKKLSLPINELLTKGDELCVNIIKWIIEQKRFPNWEKLLLGDTNLQAE